MVLFNTQLDNKGIHTFLKGISQKVNEKAGLEFKLANHDISILSFIKVTLVQRSRAAEYIGRTSAER